MRSIRTWGMGILVLISMVVVAPLAAAVRIWDGGGADSKWATPANWDL